MADAEYHRNWRKNNPEKERAKSEKWRKSNLEKCNLYKRIRRLAGFEDDKKTRYKKRYGITLEQYNEMYARQGGLCLICKKHQDVLVVDHRHEDGVIRGLLCKKCNLAIGLLYDSPESAEEAAKYLR